MSGSCTAPDAGGSGARVASPVGRGVDGAVGVDAAAGVCARSGVAGGGRGVGDGSGNGAVSSGIGAGLGVGASEGVGAPPASVSSSGVSSYVASALGFGAGATGG